MNLLSEDEDRALDARCLVPTSVPSRTAVMKLKALPPDAQIFCIAKYAENNLPHLLRCALTAGISPDTRCSEENTPVLCIAAQEGSKQALEALLVGGANVALADSNGSTAAHKAAYFGHAAILPRLLDAGAPIEAKNKRGFSPLHNSAQEGHAECCSALIASGCNVDARTVEHCTPLLYAAMFGHLAVIRVLLEAGAQLEAQGGNGRTALGIASSAGKPEAVKLLLALGADQSVMDVHGNTPLMDAILMRRNACVEALLPDSDWRITSQRGFNALHASIATSSMECFELMLPLVGDVDVRTAQGVTEDGSPIALFNATPLSLACSYGHHDMAKALLRRGALRTARDSCQRTPLHHASHYGNASCLALLLGKPGRFKLTPAEVNAADDRGLKPLHLAAFCGHANICGSLIAAGAHLHAVDSRGATPLMLAQRQHPAKTALLDLLAGRGPAHPPGTVCDGCGRPETEVQLHPCSGCWAARYCSSACNAAAWQAHKAECRRLQAEREERSRPMMVGPS